MKKIIVACGGAVATSTVAADAIRDLCKKHGIAADVQQMRIIEIGMSMVWHFSRESTVRRRKKRFFPFWRINEITCHYVQQENILLR